MKNLLLFLLIACTVFSCAENIESAEQVEKSERSTLVKSLNDFDDLIRQNPYPANKLTDRAIKEFKASLIFEKQSIRGFNHACLQKDLSDEELEMFVELLAGGNVVHVRSKEDLKAISMSVENRNCSYYHIYNQGPKDPNQYPNQIYRCLNDCDGFPSEDCCEFSFGDSCLIGTSN